MAHLRDNPLSPEALPSGVFGVINTADLALTTAAWAERSCSNLFCYLGPSRRRCRPRGWAMPAKRKFL